MFGRFENSLRLYNRKVLRRSRMHLYTKHYIDSLFHKALLGQPEVPLIAWPKDQIADYRLDKNDKRANVYLPFRGDDYEPAEKKQKLSDENDNSVIVVSSDEESDTFKSTIINSKENSNENVEKSYKSNVMYYTSNTCETTDEHMNFSNEPVKVFKSADSSRIGKITCNMSKLLKPHAFPIYCNYWIDKTAKKDKIKSTNIVTVSPASRPIKTAKQLQLSEIESLYQKYFSKSVLDNIVIIANILNIIFIANKHLKARIDESFKKKTEAEKLKERYDANRMHSRHKTILESKLKKYFLEIITKFAIPEFEPAFQMFFLSILTVLSVLDQSKFKRGRIFKNLVFLLWNSLKNSELDHVKVFSMFKSKEFRPDCIDLISLIEFSQDSNPGIADRLSIFFVSSANSQYFQAVINTVTSDSNKDLSLLIDNAAVLCSNNSKFKSSTDLTSSSAVKEVIHLKAPLSATQSFLKSDDSIQRLVLTPNGTYQPIPVIGIKSKTKFPNALENGKPSQQLNSFHKSFSNSIARVSTSNDVSKIVIPNGVVTFSPIVQNSYLQTVPTFVTFNPTLQGIKSTTISRPEGNTIYLGNKQYTVIRSPENQSREVTTTQNNILITPVSTVSKPVNIPNSTRCFKKYCRSKATIMCSTCRSAMYCSSVCQRLDWCKSHMLKCEELNNIRMSRQA